MADPQWFLLRPQATIFNSCFPKLYLDLLWITLDWCWNVRSRANFAIHLTLLLCCSQSHNWTRNWNGEKCYFERDRTLATDLSKIETNKYILFGFFFLSTSFTKSIQTVVKKNTKKKNIFLIWFPFQKCKAVGMRTTWVLTEDDKSKLALRRDMYPRYSAYSSSYCFKKTKAMSCSSLL